MADHKPRVLLTGATGFVGNAILHSLTARQAPVLVLARDPSRLTLPDTASVQFLQCDLAKITPEAAAEIKKFRPHSVVHAAWLGTENTNRNDTGFVWHNLHSSLQLLDICARAGCKQFIGFGSQAEYSPAIDADISENALAFPDTPYGVTKLATCHLLQALCKQQGINFVWLRIFASYGKNYKASYIMPYLLECFQTGQLPILKTPHAVWDYIHVDDVAAATLAALNHPEVHGIFNLGTGKGQAIGEIALMFAKILKFKDMNGLSAQIAAATDVPTRRVADIEKIKQTLQWRPLVTLQEGLITCINQ